MAVVGGYLVLSPLEDAVDLLRDVYFLNRLHNARVEQCGNVQARRVVAEVLRELAFLDTLLYANKVLLHPVHREDRRSDQHNQNEEYTAAAEGPRQGLLHRFSTDHPL